VPRSNNGMRCAKVGMLHPFLGIHRLLLGIHRLLLAIHRPLLAMLCLILPTHRPFVAMLRAFAATRCEGEGTVREESGGHHALHSLLLLVLTTPRQSRGRAVLVLTTPRQSRGRAVPSRGRGSECVGSSSERETTRSAYVGMPSKERTMPTVKRGKGCQFFRVTCFRSGGETVFEGRRVDHR
jgi:hypothetical protein